MLRFGLVSSIDPSKGVARVSFAEDEIVTDWLPIVVAGTANSYSFTFNIDEQVACMMDSTGLRGVILGAVYNQNTTPSSSGEDIVSVVFSNGDSVEYDRATGEMSITVSGGLTINGDVTVIGSLDASIDVTAGVFNTSLSTHTHPYVNVSAPATTSPPTP